MPPPVLTQCVLLVAFLFLGAYDIFVYLYWGRDATISVVLEETSHQYPIIPLWLGILIGHIFWCLR